MEAYPIQTGFMGGEITPLMYGNVDQEAYGVSVAKMLNFLPTTQGAATTRGAFAHIADIAGEPPYRILEVPITDDKGVAALLDNTTLALYDRDGPVTVGGDLVRNPNFDTGLQYWHTFRTTRADPGTYRFITDTTTWDAARKAAVQTCFSTPDFGVIQQTNIVQPITVANGVSYAITVRVEPTGSASVRARLVLPDAGANPSQPIPLIDFYNTWPERVTQNLNFGDNVINYTATADEELWLVIETTALDETQATTALFKCAMPVAGTPVPVEWTHPYTDLDYSLIQVKKVPGYNAVVLVHPQVAPHEITYDRVLETWDFAPITFVNPPAIWGTDNYPGAVGFSSGRSIYGGYLYDPDRLDLSKAGDILDFSVDPTPDAESAFIITLPEPGRVRWIRNVKELLIGTSQRVMAITAQTVLSVQDYQVNTQHGYGSVHGDTAIMANGVAHVSAFGDSIHLTNYSDSSSSFEPTDMSEFAEHLVKGYVHRLVYQREPHETLWAMNRSAGALVGMSFKRRGGKLEVMGWHQHDTVGAFEDIVSVSTSRGDAIFAVARRPRRTGGTDEDPIIDDVYTIELMEPDSVVLLDAMAMRSYATDTSTIDNLDHLEGQTVNVVREDVVEGALRLAHLGEYTVTGGEVTVDDTYAGNKFYVGHAYVPELVTLPVGGKDIQGAFKGWSEVTVRVYNSAAPRVNGQAPSDRSPQTPMDVSEPTRTTDFKIMNLGYDALGQITVTQDVPFKTTVTALFGKADISNI